MRRGCTKMTIHWSDEAVVAISIHSLINPLFGNWRYVLLWVETRDKLRYRRFRWKYKKGGEEAHDHVVRDKTIKLHYLPTTFQRSDWPYLNIIALPISITQWLGSAPLPFPCHHHHHYRPIVRVKLREWTGRDIGWTWNTHTQHGLIILNRQKQKQLSGQRQATGTGEKSDKLEYY